MILTAARLAAPPQQQQAPPPQPQPAPAPPPVVAPADTVQLNAPSNGKRVLNSAAYGVAGATVGALTVGGLTALVGSATIQGPDALALLLIVPVAGAIGAVGGGVAGAVYGWKHA